jgi:hypothetical protein
MEKENHTFPWPLCCPVHILFSLSPSRLGLDAASRRPAHSPSSSLPTLSMPTEPSSWPPPPSSLESHCLHTAFLPHPAASRAPHAAALQLLCRQLYELDARREGATPGEVSLPIYANAPHPTDQFLTSSLPGPVTRRRRRTATSHHCRTPASGHPQRRVSAW